MVTERKKLVAVEMNTLRKSCRISRIERIRNARIKEMIKMNGTILDDIKKKKLIWYDHVKIMNDERLPKITFNYVINQKRKWGRLRKNWMDGISKAMRDRGLEEDWTLDSRKWKNTFVDSSDGGI